MGNKLELTWYGKENPIKVEPRILIHDPSKNFGDSDTENMLIHGDNLLALKALEKEYTGQIKCIYIDPPYNVDAMNEHYDDLIEHSAWLNKMRPRLQILRTLLCMEGSIWIQISDAEQAYNRGHHYEPDFVVETEDIVYLVEVKGEDRIDQADVLAKKDRALRYCKVVSEWGRANNYKCWQYLFIPSQQISESSTFANLVKRFVVDEETDVIH